MEEDQQVSETWDKDTFRHFPDLFASNVPLPPADKPSALAEGASAAPPLAGN
jgi:hypothetical protein